MEQLGALARSRPHHLRCTAHFLPLLVSILQSPRSQRARADNTQDASLHAAGEDEATSRTVALGGRWVGHRRAMARRHTTRNRTTAISNSRDGTSSPRPSNRTTTTATTRHPRTTTLPVATTTSNCSRRNPHTVDMARTTSRLRARRQAMPKGICTMERIKMTTQ